MWSSGPDEWPNRHQDLIYDWWMSELANIPKEVQFEARFPTPIDYDYEFMEVYLKHNFPELVFQGPHHEDDMFTKDPSSKIVKADPVAKDVAMRKGLMYVARKLLPRAVPYVGWGLLAKDIYDFFKD